MVTGGCACTGDACACVTAAVGVAVAGGAVSWATGAALNWFTPGGIRPGLNPPGPGIPTTNGNTGLDNKIFQRKIVNIFLPIIFSKMFCVLKRSVSLRRFF